MIAGVTFARPWVFLLLLLLPLLLWFYYQRKKRGTEPALVFSSFTLFGIYRGNWRTRLSILPLLLRLLAVMFFIIALAGPQKFNTGENVYTEGIDIALVLDISGSMLAEDFRPNRLDAAKKITADFIDNRLNDRIGLVIFSRDAFTQCPVTIDYTVLKNLLKDIRSGMLEDGTAIGNALANGVNRLKDSKAKSKVLILLTDGVNNAGEVDPMTAAEIASRFGIRVYTVGIGTVGQAPYPFQTPFGIRYQMVPVEIDEALLKKIAAATGGKYFRATGNKKLESIYGDIDKLEKSRVEVTSYRSKSELFFPWLLAGLLAMAAEFLAARILLRRIP